MQLSKSNFLSGIQCVKKLFYEKYRKDLIPSEENGDQDLMDFGHEIGMLARRYFEGGKDATEGSYLNYDLAVANTNQWNEERLKTIYEATFLANGLRASLDIFHRKDDEVWAIEVKSSTEVKDYHLTDASFQYHVMESSGVKPDRFFLMHIDNSYEKNGPLDITQLFTLADITKDVISNQTWVRETIASLRTSLSNQTEPNQPIGKHCNEPFACQFTHHCWKHLPKEGSVFDLYSPRGKEWQLYQNGVFSLKDIDENVAKLSSRQLLQVRGAKKGESYFDVNNIKNFLTDWEYPLYFFDFETVFPAVPLLNKSYPYHQVPFQFSLHILESPQGEVVHREFLANPASFTEDSTQDPRVDLIEALKTFIGPAGSIVAYNASFEIGVLKNLAAVFPSEKTFLHGLIDRFVDLLVPFRSGWYYLPEMGGSASIKSVLPAIAPKFSYDDLEITNGGDASNIFLAMIKSELSIEHKETREALLKYCERDTYGMVIIYRKLLALIQE